MRFKIYRIEPHQSTSETPPSGGHAAMRLLVVEDEQKVASFIQQGLSEEGHAVDVAHDGEMGLAMALDRVHDLILLDLSLPKKGGLEVLQAVRQARIKTPILLLTV